jgi:hypothetical protein
VNKLGPTLFTARAGAAMVKNICFRFGAGGTGFALFLDRTVAVQRPEKRR